MDSALEQAHEQLLRLAVELPGVDDARQEVGREARVITARRAYYNALRIVRHVAGMTDLPPFNKWTPKV